jgi:multiple sugar transport system permease protein
MNIRGSLKGWLLFSPWIVTFLVFWLFPLIYSFILSLTDYRLLAPEASWIGFDNYTRLFSDPDFLIALKNSFIFVIGTIPFTTVIALIFAILLNDRFRGHRSRQWLSLP